jgi:hypothetical protein
MERLQELRLRKRQTAEAYSISMGFISDNRQYRLNFMKMRNAVSNFECMAEAVAELCVVKNLPGGTCYISQQIMRYV